MHKRDNKNRKPLVNSPKISVKHVNRLTDDRQNATLNTPNVLLFIFQEGRDEEIYYSNRNYYSGSYGSGAGYGSYLAHRVQLQV